MTDKELFQQKVIPVMNRVREDLQNRQTEELKRHMNSPAFLLAGAAGPDGGMTAQSAQIDLLRTVGKWNSKTVEDYVAMVKKELQRQKITVTPAIEKMMIDKMVRDQMPKSSIEYIMRKAAGNSLFGLNNELRKSPLQQEIDSRGEALYNPKKWEKGLGIGLGATADFFAMGGTGIANGLKFVGVDLALNAVISTASNNDEKPNGKTMSKNEEQKQPYVPLCIALEHREDYLKSVREQENAEKQKQQSQPKPTKEEQLQEPKTQSVEHSEVTPSQESAEKDQVQHTDSSSSSESQQNNTGGWQSIMSGLGLNGFSDLGRNAGYILAMLPDILVGLFTGRTKSLGFKDNLMPIASIVAGMFVKNPLLKMTLIGLGGANLLNKAGHEELARRNTPQITYRPYADEALNPRIEEPQLKGNTLIATIDRIPVSVTLPQRVVDAYSQGALPMNTLANAVLAQSDRTLLTRQAQERYEQQSQEISRPLTQR